MHRILDRDSTCRHIKRISDENGATIGLLSEEMNVSKQTVYAWFSGKKLPSIDHLIELADILNISIDELIVTKPYSVDGQASLNRGLIESRDISRYN